VAVSETCIRDKSHQATHLRRTPSHRMDRRGQVQRVRARFNAYSSHTLTLTYPSTLPARQHPRIPSTLSMADSYYEGQTHSATSGGSVSPSPYSNEYQPNGGAGAAERAISPNTSYGNGVDVKPNIDAYGHGDARSAAGNGASGAAAAVVKKRLASWVGFSNLPNQVHRRSVR